MPALSEFYGISIYMNFINSEHNPPHIHVKYSGYSASIEIESLIVTGELPARAKDMVIEWIIEYKLILLEMWKSQKFIKIPPLK